MSTLGRSGVLILACAVCAALMGQEAGWAAGQGSRNSPIDLVQTSCVVPAKVTAGKKFRVLDQVENAGSEFAVESVTYYYLSANAEIDTDDIVISGRRVPRLEPGQQSSYPTLALMPAGVPPGDYYVIAKANADGRLEERYLDNNTVATKITVEAAEKKLE